MKTHLLLLILLISCLNAFSQAFIMGENSKYGVPTGTNVAAGNIYTMHGDGLNYLQRYYFNVDHAGMNPFGTLAEASNGKLYGMADGGGSNNLGVIFSLDPATATYAVEHSFDGIKGSYPQASVVQATDGLLYGMTPNGGSSDFGVLFSFDPSTSTFTMLKEFTGGTEGAIPYGSLIQAGNGMLYGMTIGGGNYGAGNIFSYDISTNTYSNVHDFDGVYGYSPFGDLMEASNGLLYGVAGPWIFSFDPASNTFASLLNLATPPYSFLIEATDGNFYGLNGYGGTYGTGSIYKYDPVANAYTDIYSFTGVSDGGYPLGGLVQASDGILYGMGEGGGNSFLGTVFSYDLASSTFTKLVDLDGSGNGATPGLQSLMEASDGNLYGLTNSGGIAAGQFGFTSGAGVLFKYDIAAGVNSKVVDFNTSTNGAYPKGGLMQASNGKVYGTTEFGGSSDAGVIFSFDPDVYTYTKLHDFDIATGGNPSSTFAEGSNGLLYGTAANGGAFGQGVFYSFDPSSNTFSWVADFNGTNGAYPQGRLVEGSDGLIYGTAREGGVNAVGVLFSYDPVTNVLTNVHDFDVTEGAFPEAGLILSPDGKLYGTTFNGGGFSNPFVANDLGGVGVLFSYDPLINDFVDLLNFSDLLTNTGALPKDLIASNTSVLFGTTQSGGIGGGLVYEFDPLTNSYTLLKDLDTTVSGGGILVEPSDNRIYGVTNSVLNDGVIYNYDPVTNFFDGPNDLPVADGKFSTVSLLEMDFPSHTIQVSDGSYEFSINPNPAEDHFTLSLTQPVTNASIEIFDAIGKSVYQAMVDNQSPKGFTKQILLNAAPGMYLVKIFDGGKEYSRKLIIQ